MPKRVRGSRSSTHRPGGQGPSRVRRSGETSASEQDARWGDVVGADIDGAVEAVEGGYTEFALDEAPPSATKSRRTRRTPKVRADGLRVRATAEDAFVREDLRRIGLVSIVLVVGLAVAWALFYAMDLLGLY